MLPPVCPRVRARLVALAALVLATMIPASGSAQTATYKIASWNIQSGKGEPALPGNPVTFYDTSNCSDPSKPLNAWGLGFVQKHLRDSIGSDPAIVALGLLEAWPCGSPENVRQALGWKSRSSERNGVGIVAKFGFAGPEEWLQLDTSLNTNAADTMWVLRIPVCLDSACSQSVNVFTAHWYGTGTNKSTSYDRQAKQTVEFLQRAGGAEPHVLIGDLNVWQGVKVCSQSPNDYGWTRLRDAGYLDAWPLLHGSAEGLTGMVNRAGCGTPDGYAWKRIDYAWSPANHAALSIKRFGMTTPGTEAPSDHYGIIAEFPMPGGSIDPAPAPEPEPEPAPAPAPAPVTTAAADIVLHAKDATITSGLWRVVNDAQAAGGARLSHPDQGAAKLAAALAAPANYFELTLTAEANRAYRLWIRGRGDNDHWANDSVFVQFTGSVDSGGAPVTRIGTTGSATVNLEDDAGRGIAGWGWQDNGYGAGVLGPLVYFATSGPQTVRVQTREDGFSIDQIVLSSDQFLTTPPGALKNDATIYAATAAQTGTTAGTRLVRSGENFQSALDAAQPGDVIMLEAGATFRGNYTLPVKAGATVITIRSSAPDSALPGAGVRITPAFSALLATIQSPNTAPALKTAPGAHHWRLQFLEFGPNQYGQGEIIQLGDGSSAQNQLSQVPFEIVVDRVYIHGDPVIGQKRGIALNGRAVTIRDSYVSDIKVVAQDSQAIAGWNGPGPYLIENNYLEAAGENVLLGGADPAIPNLVTEDVVFRYNHVSRPMAWRSEAWQVKNLFELKNARRVLVEYNIFENNWAGAQPGYAILLTPRNQDGGCPWCVVEDVTFQYNIVRNVGGGINITGFDNLNVCAQTSNIRISNNLFHGVTQALGGTGWFILIGSEPRNVVVDHNTVDADGEAFVYAYGGSATDPKAIYGFELTNNAARHNTYGLTGANFSSGNSAIAAYFPDGLVRGNWLAGGDASLYPSGNLFAGAFADAFVNQAAADYRVAAGSILAGAATDGTNIGADVSAIHHAVGGVVEGLPGTPAPPPDDTDGDTPPDTTPTDPPPAAPSGEIVLFAKNATTLAGNWQIVEDATAAAGARVWNPDRKAPKNKTAQSNPADYVEMAFSAQAGRPYRLWIRGLAERNSWANDSVFVQFSGSVTSGGAAIYRIGTTDGTWINLEDGANAGLAGWGWQDNGYGAGVLGPPVYFTEGQQKIRIQVREDGLSIDQIVLSSATYLTSAPGALKNDATILAAAADTSTSTREIVLSAKEAARVAGNWSSLADVTAAGGVAVGSPDAGAAKSTTAAATPTNYVEFTFQVEAGTPYRLWLRGRADRDSWANDSVFVQFSNSTNAGAPAWRIGTTDSVFVNLEDAANAGVSGWGWQDNGYGAAVFGPVVTFATGGTQTLRIQTREDGFRIDQIVLSAEKYLTTSPGALKNDTTIVK